MKSKKARGAKAAPKATTQETSADEIRFYRANEKPYGAFSNLFRCEVAFEDQNLTTGLNNIPLYNPE